MVRGYAEPKIVFGLDYLQMWKLETISLWHFRARRLLRRNPFSIHERDQAYLLDVDNFVFDKQVVRDWLNAQKGWNKQPPGPVLPDDVVRETTKRYREVYETIAGRSLDEAIADATR